MQWLVLFEGLDFGWTLNGKAMRLLADALDAGPVAGGASPKPFDGAKALAPYARPFFDPN